jgi:hypothetical protein
VIVAAVAVFDRRFVGMERPVSFLLSMTIRLFFIHGEA